MDEHIVNIVETWATITVLVVFVCVIWITIKQFKEWWRNK